MADEAMEYYKMIAWDGCPYCAGAYDLLRMMGKDVHVVYHARGSKELQEAKQAHNWRTVPIITRVEVDGEVSKETFIGGFDDLKKFIDGVGGSLG